MAVNESVKMFESEIKHLAGLIESYIRKQKYFDKTIKVLFKYRGVYQGLEGKFHTEKYAEFLTDIPGNLDAETLIPLLTEDAVDAMSAVYIEGYHVSRMVGINFYIARVEGVY